LRRLAQSNVLEPNWSRAIRSGDRSPRQDLRRSDDEQDRGAGVRHPRRRRPGGRRPGRGPGRRLRARRLARGVRRRGIVLEWESRTEALLLGRKTYEIFARSWGVWDENAEGLKGELTRRYNRIPKYVASRTLTEVGWQNTKLLGPDVPAAVEKLRAEPGGEIRVWGSTQLIRTLAEHDLVDEYRLVLYPLVLGTGKKLFPTGSRSPDSP